MPCWTKVEGGRLLLFCPLSPPPWASASSPNFVGGAELLKRKGKTLVLTQEPGGESWRSWRLRGKACVGVEEDFADIFASFVESVGLSGLREGESLALKQAEVTLLKPGENACCGRA